MVSLPHLKSRFNFSDEEVCEHWSERWLWQFVSSLDYYENRLLCDATQVGRLRHEIVEDGLEFLLNGTLAWKSFDRDLVALAM